MKASFKLGMLAAASAALASCHINNGKLDMSWVSDRVQTPQNDEVQLEGARSAGPTVAVPAPATAPEPGVPAPIAAAAPAAAPAAKAGTYIVKAGDTLGGIAARHHTTAAAIASANHIANPNALKLGQVLHIPAAPAKPAVKKATVPASRYTVKSGDTLSAISRRTGVPVQQLMRANNMSSSNLSVGAKLTIPKH